MFAVKLALKRKLLNCGWHLPRRRAPPRLLPPPCAGGRRRAWRAGGPAGPRSARAGPGSAPAAGPPRLLTGSEERRAQGDCPARGRTRRVLPALGSGDREAGVKPGSLAGPVVLGVRSAASARALRGKVTSSPIRDLT